MNEVVHSSYRISTHVTFRSTSADLKMLFDRDKGVMYELNETASIIVQCIADGIGSPSAIAAHLAQEYEADPNEILEGVERIVEDFEKAGLLTAAQETKAQPA